MTSALKETRATKRLKLRSLTKQYETIKDEELLDAEWLWSSRANTSKKYILGLDEGSPLRRIEREAQADVWMHVRAIAQAWHRKYPPYCSIFVKAENALVPLSNFRPERRRKAVSPGAKDTV